MPLLQRRSEFYLGNEFRGVDKNGFEFVVRYVPIVVRVDHGKNACHLEKKAQ